MIKRIFTKDYTKEDYEHSIQTLVRELKYTRQQAINLLDGKNYDGTSFEQLSF